MFDMSQMEGMVWQFFAREVNKLPLEAKEALKQLTVEIVRQPDRVIVLAKPDESQASGKAAQVILNSIVEPTSKIVGAFGARVEVYR